MAGAKQRSVGPGVLLGLGLGGFIDGIVLHQILQWHNMGSAVVPPTTMDAMQQNMTWDGLFHAVTWTMVTAGVYLLLRDARAGAVLPSARAFTGQLVLGWGIFNLVEGVVDHHLLGIHHVRDILVEGMMVHVPGYDWAFLLVGGLGLIAFGWVLARGDAPVGRSP